MSGLLVMQHGTTKILSLPVTQHTGTPIASMSGAAGVIELVCGFLVVVGLFTRPAAFLLSGMNGCGLLSRACRPELLSNSQWR